MAWFIITEERKTWTKFIIEADSEELALELSDSWEYLGYLDGDCTEVNVIGHPFKTKEDALSDLISYTEG